MASGQSSHRAVFMNPLLPRARPGERVLARVQWDKQYTASGRLGAAVARACMTGMSLDPEAGSPIDSDNAELEPNNNQENHMAFHGRTALVTGAASGMGRRSEERRVGERVSGWGVAE